MIYVNARFLTQKVTGVQRYAIEISKRLKKIDPKICFVSPKNVLHEDVAEELEVNRVGHFKGHLWEQVELPFYLKNKQGLLVNLANCAPLLLKNQLCCIYDLSFHRYPECFSKSFTLLYNFLIPRVACNSRGIITISHFSKNEIKSVYQIHDEKIKTIYCGMSLNLIGSNRTSNSHGRYILAVASLDPRKNFERLVEAYLQLGNTDVKLLICGDKSKSFNDVSLDKLFHSNPNIVHLGHVTDEELATLYQHAALFVYPSIYEGFGMPPLEAMANGCPALVSAIPSHQEIFGDSVCYCDPYQTLDIRNKINFLLENSHERNRLIQKGRDHYKKYNWDNSAKQLNDYIKSFDSCPL